MFIYLVSYHLSQQHLVFPFACCLEIRLLAMLACVKIGHGEPVLHGRRNARENVGRGRRAAVQRKGGGRRVPNNGARAVEGNQRVARGVAEEEMVKINRE